MPAVDSTIRPRHGGHIDTPDALVDALVGVSVEAHADDLIMLHLDVARGGDVEIPFSVGIPLSHADAALVMLAVRAAVTINTGGRTERRDRPN